jgi:hypothetical protein
MTEKAMMKLRGATAGYLMVALVFLAISGSIRADGSALAVNDQKPGLSLHKDFPQTKLRGYGSLSGKDWTDATGGSLLQIECQDVEHARLVQAKYLSDLAEIPPATQPGQIDVGGTKISIQSADNVGAVTALRSGTTVVLAGAKTADALAKLITNSVKGNAANWTSVAEGKIPMFLDRFDKYGFRFYYGPGNLKTDADGHEIADYDPREDFNFMQATHTGLLIWHTNQSGETNESLNSEPSWDWTLAMAHEKGLPFGINLGINGAANWYFNRHPESMMQYAPGFLGTYYGSMNFGISPMVSWSSAAGQDAMLAPLQTTVRHLNDVDNITSWLEPHEELGGGVADLLVDYGPLADANFRVYLKGKYKTIEAVAQRYQDAGLTTWDQMHVPEPATFLGWNGDALDLSGPWKVSFDSADNAAAQAPDFDDSKWGGMDAPNNGLARMLPMKPALWRRHVTIDGGWLGKHPATWLYVWDMNDTRDSETNPAKAVVVSMNGKIQAEDKPYHGQDHWAAYDVTKAIQSGNNLLAVRLPQGLFNYRVYLSGDAPKSYPQLGEGKNALWVDYSDWLSDVRGKGVKRGMQMIRQVDPNRGIVLMAPDSYEDELIQDAIEYGGDFHNTGYMAGWWCDKEPALMRGAGLPFSTEPGGGPTIPWDILVEMGNWFTQGVNTIDHFQTIGEVLYHPDLKKTFEDHAAMYTSIGRFHAPVAQIAALYSSKTTDFLGWPWSEHPAGAANGEPYFRSGSYVSAFNCRGFFSPMENMPKGTPYDSDAVNDGMLERNQANKYRVIVDTDTAVMDKAMIDGIERFVRGGGVFVTYGETGRHSPEKPDSWPIDRLTGYHFSDEKPSSGAVALDATQKVFLSSLLFSGEMAGHRLTAITPGVQSLLKWNDGSPAVGLRPLGKGFIVTVGPWFNAENGNAFMSGLFQWLKIDPIPAHMETSGNILWRHYITNNGLYDMWVIWNKDRKTPTQGTLVLDPGLRPEWSVDLKTGTRSSLTDGKLAVNLPTAEMAIYITPRPEIAGASSEWFDLQRGWWQGSGELGKPLSKPEMKIAMDITDGWAFQPLDEKADVAAMVGPKVDDSKWKQMSLGIFTLPDYPDARHAVIRKHIHVPDAWNHGRVLVHLAGFRTWGAVYLDGQSIRSDTAVLAGGSDHLLAVEMKSTGYLMGPNGPAWLNYHPDPMAKQDITGSFQSSSDFLTWNASIPLPGEIAQGTRALRTGVTIVPEAADKTVVLHAMENSGELHGAVVNGHYVVPFAREGSELNINITPWIVLGKKNEVVLLMGGSHETITALALEFHQNGTYP